MSVWEAHRNAERTCDERDPNDFGLDCFGASLGAGLGGAFRQGWSHATVVPATALAAGSGYFFGAAARRAPSAVLGGSLLVGGVLTWAIPRTLYLGNGVPDDWRDELRLMDGTFYAGFAAVGLGAALLAAMEGARSANARLQALSFAVDPRGLSVSGRF